jgi:hypothetical protein
VPIALDSLADFEDDEKTLKAVEKLYSRAIQYNDLYQAEGGTNRFSVRKSDFRAGERVVQDGRNANWEMIHATYRRNT